MHKIKILLIILTFLSYSNFAVSNENFYEKAKQKYDEKKIEDAKFLFQRSIVFNPKKTKSYLYLAKIYNHEKNSKEEEKNIKTVLLLEPTNEEALYMQMNIELKKSNYFVVKNSLELFSKVCNELCNKKELILESLKDLEPKNDS